MKSRLCRRRFFISGVGHPMNSLKIKITHCEYIFFHFHTQ